MHVVVLQYAGDYRGAVQNFSKGGLETYYAQKYSVDAVANLRQYAEKVSFVCCMSEQPYDEILENGVRAISAGFQDTIDPGKLIQLLKELKPTHLILQTPIRPILKWAIKNQVRTLVMLPESIVLKKGLRGKVGGFLLSKLLNSNQVDWVGSYGIASSMTLKEMGVNPNKIIPWDFLISDTPGSYEPKQLKSNPETWDLLYVGSMLEAKGVGDILDAVALLRSQSLPVTLKLVGRDTGGYFANKAQQLGIADSVEFLGLIPNKEVVPLMRSADIVLVPSRHEYTEGFPLTIHHALCARTPIVASDHPMFQHNLKHGTSALIFPAGDSGALANTIKKLLNNPDLYSRLSTASYPTWYRLRLPAKFADIVNRWLDNTAASNEWLLQHRLVAEQYSQSSLVSTPELNQASELLSSSSFLFLLDCCLLM